MGGRRPADPPLADTTDVLVPAPSRTSKLAKRMQSGSVGLLAKVDVEGSNDELDPALLRKALTAGDQPLLDEAQFALGKTATIEAMRAAVIRPALVYAYERTGLLVSRENRRLMSAADLDEWDDAIAEYEEKHQSQ